MSSVDDQLIGRARRSTRRRLHCLFGRRAMRQLRWDTRAVDVDYVGNGNYRVRWTKPIVIAGLGLTVTCLVGRHAARGPVTVTCLGPDGRIDTCADADAAIETAAARAQIRRERAEQQRREHANA
jgi:hypothetical protein